MERRQGQPQQTTNKFEHTQHSRFLQSPDSKFNYSNFKQSQDLTSQISKTQQKVHSNKPGNPWVNPNRTTNKQT